MERAPWFDDVDALATLRRVAEEALMRPSMVASTALTPTPTMSTNDGANETTARKRSIRTSATLNTSATNIKRRWVESVFEELARERERVRAAPENAWHPRGDEPVMHPLNQLVLRTTRDAEAARRAVRDAVEAGSTPFGVGTGNASLHWVHHQEQRLPRVDLELVPKAWEDSFLRAPRGAESACSAGEQCEGVALERKCPDWPRDAKGFTLVQFRTPEESAGRRPRSRHGLCLLCVRARVSSEWIRRFDEGDPAPCTILPHRNMVGRVGEYRIDACVPRDTSKFFGVQDTFVRFRASNYKLVAPGVYAQRGVDFCRVPHVLPAPLPTLRLRPFGFDVEPSTVASAGPRTSESGEEEENDDDDAAIRAYARDEAGLRDDASVELFLRAARFNVGRVVDVGRRLLQCGLVGAANPRASCVVALLAAAISGNESAKRSAQLNAFEARLNAALSGTDTDVADDGFDDWDGPEEAALLATHAVRATMGGHWPRARRTTLREECLSQFIARTTRSERVAWLRAHPATVLVALREYVTYAAEFDDLVRRRLESSTSATSWRKFSRCARRAADAVRRRCAALRDAENESVTALENAVSFTDAFSATAPWFWDRVARCVDACKDPRVQALRDRTKAVAKMFDGRFAYEGVDAVLEQAERVGYDARAIAWYRDAVLSPPTRLAWSEFVGDVVDICCVVQQSFQVRVVRAPRHWCRLGTTKTKEQPFHLFCYECRELKSHVFAPPGKNETRRGRRWRRGGNKKRRDDGDDKGKEELHFQGSERVALDWESGSYLCCPKNSSSERENRRRLQEQEEEDAVDGDDQEEEPAERATVHSPATKTKNVRGHFSIVPRADCRVAECVPFESRGNVVEFFGRVLGECWTCGRLTAPRDDLETNALLCLVCTRVSTPRSCVVCGRVQRRAGAKWSSVRVFRAGPFAEKEDAGWSRTRDAPTDSSTRVVWFCPEHHSRTLERARIVDFETLSATLEGLGHNRKRPRRAGS